MSKCEYAQPRDPSLALCQICANAGDVTMYAESMDGRWVTVRTCSRIKCNDFVPGNIKGLTLQDRAKMMMEMAQYGRPKA